MKLFNTENGKEIYMHNNRVYIVFPPEYPKAKILKEVLNQTRAEDCGVSVPSIQSISKTKERWVIVSSYEEGKSIQQLMDENPDDFDMYLSLFVDIHRQIISNHCVLLTELKDKIIHRISDTDYDAVTRYDLQIKAGELSNTDYLLHGRFFPQNIYIKPDGSYYIVDWEQAVQGDPAADISSTYLYFTITGKREIAEKYLDLICNEHYSRENVMQWIPIIAASQQNKVSEERRKIIDELVLSSEYQR